MQTYTPGVTRQLTQTQICTTHWGLDKRHVTIAMKMQVAGWYGVPWADRLRYEFDHLIPRELGGADDVRNIWAQPLAEAKIKDREENRLHQAVCAGTMTLEAARAEIMQNWGGQ